MAAGLALVFVDGHCITSRNDTGRYGGGAARQTTPPRKAADYTRHIPLGIAARGGTARIARAAEDFAQSRLPRCNESIIYVRAASTDAGKDGIYGTKPGFAKPEARF